MSRTIALLLSIAATLALVGPVAAEVDFAKDVKPILEATCIRCHGPEKTKGKLRLDSQAGLMKGSENGPVLVPGKAAESKMIKLVDQPKTSEDRMPPEGDPLAKPQIEVLTKWINEGAKWPDGLVLKAAGAAAVTPTAVATKDDPGLPISDAEKAAVAKLQGGGVLAIRLAQNTNLLRVDFSLRGKEVKDDELVSLKDIPNLTELNLGGTAVTDASLSHLRPLTNLTRLSLHNTKITDVGLANLKGMTKLISLNLYGTGVSDQGLENLAALSSLKRLFVWQTKVTPEGAKKIAGAVKGLDVERGYDAPPPAEPVKAKEAPKTPEKPKAPEKPKEAPKATEKPKVPEKKDAPKTVEKPKEAPKAPEKN